MQIIDPRNASMELIPIPPMNSLISCFHAVIRLIRRLLPVDGSSLFTSSGAANLDYRTLNEALRGAETDYIAKDCRGQRFIAAGMSDINLTIEGIPGTGEIADNAFVILMKSEDDDY